MDLKMNEAATETEATAQQLTGEIDKLAIKIKRLTAERDKAFEKMFREMRHADKKGTALRKISKHMRRRLSAINEELNNHGNFSSDNGFDEEKIIAHIDGAFGELWEAVLPCLPVIQKYELRENRKYSPFEE